MIRFEVEAITSIGEHAVYVASSKGGNDRALFLVFDSPEAAKEAADKFSLVFKQVNDLHG